MLSKEVEVVVVRVVGLMDSILIASWQVLRSFIQMKQGKDHKERELEESEKGTDTDKANQSFPGLYSKLMLFI